MDDGLIKAEVFGKKVLQSVLAGSYYVRAFKGMLIVSKVLNHTPFMVSVRALKDTLCSHNIPPDLIDNFQTVVSSSEEMHLKFEAFTAECEAKSELCKYLTRFYL
jgi:hypothetical protein